MDSNQEIGQDRKIINSQSSRDDSIKSCLITLKSKGEYLINVPPSDIDNDFFIELEGTVNSLYGDLDKGLVSGESRFKPKVITALMTIIDEEILPAVSEWSGYAKIHPDQPRSRELLRNIKSIGKKLRDLKI